MRATVEIAGVRDCEAKRLFDAPVCKYLQMLEACVGLPKRSIVVKYRHQEHEYIRVLGAPTKETKCLRAISLEKLIGADTPKEFYVGELHCRVVQPNETFTITVHAL